MKKTYMKKFRLLLAVFGLASANESKAVYDAETWLSSVWSRHVKIDHAPRVLSVDCLHDFVYEMSFYKRMMIAHGKVMSLQAQGINCPSGSWWFNSNDPAVLDSVSAMSALHANHCTIMRLMYDASTASFSKSKYLLPSGNWSSQSWRKDCKELLDPTMKESIAWAKELVQLGDEKQIAAKLIFHATLGLDDVKKLFKILEEKCEVEGEDLCDPNSQRFQWLQNLEFDKFNRDQAYLKNIISYVNKNWMAFCKRILIDAGALQFVSSMLDDINNLARILTTREKTKKSNRFAATWVTNIFRNISVEFSELNDVFNDAFGELHKEVEKKILNSGSFTTKIDKLSVLYGLSELTFVADYEKIEKEFMAFCRAGNEDISAINTKLDKEKKADLGIFGIVKRLEGYRKEMRDSHAKMRGNVEWVESEARDVIEEEEVKLRAKLRLPLDIAMQPFHRRVIEQALKREFHDIAEQSKRDAIQILRRRELAKLFLRCEITMLLTQEKQVRPSTVTAQEDARLQLVLEHKVTKLPIEEKQARHILEQMIEREHYSAAEFVQRSTVEAEEADKMLLIQVLVIQGNPRRYIEKTQQDEFDEIRILVGKDRLNAIERFAIRDRERMEVRMRDEMRRLLDVQKEAYEASEKAKEKAAQERKKRVLGDRRNGLISEIQQKRAQLQLMQGEEQSEVKKLLLEIIHGKEDEKYRLEVCLGRMECGELDAGDDVAEVYASSLLTQRVCQAAHLPGLFQAIPEATPKAAAYDGVSILDLRGAVGSLAEVVSQDSDYSGPLLANLGLGAAVRRLSEKKIGGSHEVDSVHDTISVASVEHFDQQSSDGNANDGHQRPGAAAA